MQGWRRNKGIKGNEMVNDGKRNEVALSQVCTLNMGQSPSSDSYNENKDGLPFFQGNADFGDIFPKERVWCSQPTKIANKDDILLSVRAPIGALNIAKEECCIGRGLAALSPIPSQCRMMYLFYALKSKVKILEQQGTGSTFKAVGKDTISALHIPLYPLEEQEHIISKLSCTDKRIANIYKQIAKLDTLVKSRFIEMFGDLESNPKGWKKVTFDEVSEKITDGEHATVPRVDKGYVFLNARNILKRGEIDLTGVTFISEENHNRIYKRCNPEPGDVLLTTTGTIGNVAIVPKIDAFSMDRGITLIKQDRSVINGTFFAVAMQMDSLQMHMKNGIHASAIGHLFMNKVKALPIVVPPIDLQNQFADFVEQVDKSKSVLQKLLEKQELLRAALMQEYFG